MNNEAFVKALVEVVRDAVMEDAVEDLLDPPGRSPSQKDRYLSEWFKDLSVEDSNRVKDVIMNAVDSTLFGVLAVFDGVRAIENQDKGKLELYYIKGDEKVLLNDIQEEYLHDIYNRIIK